MPNPRRRHGRRFISANGRISVKEHRHGEHWEYYREKMLVGWGNWTASLDQGARRGRLTPNLAREYARSASAIEEAKGWAWIGDPIHNPPDLGFYHGVWGEYVPHEDDNWALWDSEAFEYKDFEALEEEAYYERDVRPLQPPYPPIVSWSELREAAHGFQLA